MAVAAVEAALDSAPAAAPALDWRWALPRIALVFLVTRLLVFGVGVAVEVTQEPPPPGVEVDERPILASLTAWDGRYYLGIARDGYHAEPVHGQFADYAFFPLYPIVVRAVSVLTLGDGALAAVLAANTAFALALAALFALSVRYLTPERSIRSLWYLALAPGAVAFALAYSDSLFLLLAVGAFLAAETKHPWLAGIAYALATLTRPPGILLGLPLLVLYIDRDGLRPTRSWVPLLLGPLALAAFFGYLWSLTGDPVATIAAQQAWGLPPETDATRVPGSGDATTGLAPGTPLVVAIWLGTLALYLFLFVFFRHDHVRPSYWILAILPVASVFAAGRLMSVPRFLAVAWPFDWVLAHRRSAWVPVVLLPALAVLQVLLGWMAFTWELAP